MVQNYDVTIFSHLKPLENSLYAKSRYQKTVVLFGIFSYIKHGYKGQLLEKNTKSQQMQADVELHQVTVYGCPTGNICHMSIKCHKKRLHVMYVQDYYA